MWIREVWRWGGPPLLPGCAHPVLAGLNQCCPLCQCCCFFQPCPPPLAVPELVSFLVDVGELPWSRGPGRFLPPQFVFSSPSPYYNPRIHKVWPLGVNVWLPLYICSHLRVLGEVCLCPINGGLFFSPPPLVFCVLPKNLPALPGDVTIYSWASVINGWADWWVADRRGVIILWMCHLQLVVGTQTENRYATVQRNQALLWPKSGWRWLVLLHGALLSPHGLLFVSLGGGGQDRKRGTFLKRASPRGWIRSVNKTEEFCAVRGSFCLPGFLEARVHVQVCLFWILSREGGLRFA